MKKALSLLLVLVMLIGMMPQMTLFAHAEEVAPVKNELAGKTISILGASISTYADTSNGSAADTTNSTIRKNVKYYPNTTIPEVTLNDTWWMQVTKDLGLRLLVNNAWSGSAILLERSGTVGAYVDRCVQLHDNTGDNAGEEPDIICIQMGFNDFSYGKDTLGTADIDYDALITADGYGTPTTTMEATAIMLDKMVKRYPNAEIYMFNHFKRIGQSASETTLMENLNASIATVCARYGVTVVDLYTALTEPGHIGDGRLHPNRLGMDTISEAVKEAIIAHTDYAVDTHTVTLNLNGVTANYVNNKIVVAGDAFSVELNAADELKVTVTMGGKDITESAYADGTVTIDTVTADVAITAESVHNPKDYRWEFNGTDLVCVSGDNTLTKNAGTTTNGVFSKTRYTLENEVVLLHDRPWVVEWKCEGTFLNTNGSSGARIFTSDNVNANYNARYIFKSNTNGIIAMGEKTTSGSHNYGIALGEHGIDWTALHTYRLENRISDDGSNMVYLFVDGKEIGPMNHYYIGTKDQSKTSDWLSGKDFVFPYMGTDTHGFTNASIEYIQVTECLHTYKNGTCTSCGAEHPNLQNYNGKVISILGDSISTFAGYIPVADGFNLEHLARYPQDNLLTNVNETWWMQVVAELDAKLGINDSWRGATVSGAKPVTTGTTGENAAMANLTRIQNLGANGTPDVILFYGGTNDLAHVSNVGSFDPDTAPAVADLTTKKWDNLADAYVHTLLRLRYYYPDATVIAMLPTYTKSYYSADKLAQANALLAQICDHYDVTYVDLRYCGITVNDLPDGIHPDANGMDYISAAVLEALLDGCEMEAGENVVHTVTHNLTGAESALGYYKGVTHGKSFVTTITGEDVAVSVTMGGVDITDAVYADGIVTIMEVTGDIVITAEGHVKPIYEDHLQQLPENVCSGTNLWAVLEHDKQYYTLNGWGTHSSGTVCSVTFPISAGDRIYATSFDAAGNNGSSINGIRVTWFDECGLLETVSADKVYAEFSANGYLAVPEGATVVSIPMWKVSDTNEIYILNRDHCYENGACTGCGAAQPGPVITLQPVDSEAAMGETFCVTVEAEGEGLKYQWYFRNAGTTVWHKSGVRDNTYDDVMTQARAGREVYCVITDANGNSVTTEIAKLIRVPSEKLEIVTQPADGEAVLGERYCVTVEAKGDGLKYQWYFRNAGSETWYKSSVRDNTYDDVMTTARAGREVYCVITDACGNTVTTDIVKLVRVPMKLEIVSQPTDAETTFGEMFCATVEAKGEGLKYQWYFRNAGSDTWHKSGVRDNTYDDVMTKARNGREIYCVITDMWGNSVTTNTVKLIAVPSVELNLLGVSYESAAMGERFCATVNVQGEGLVYQWYFRNAGSDIWYKSGVRDNTYDDVMTRARANREVYCVITDAFGNQIVTEVVTLVLDN